MHGYAEVVGVQPLVRFYNYEAGFLALYGYPGLSVLLKRDRSNDRNLILSLS